MENSKVEGYVAGSISILISVFFLTGSAGNNTTMAIGSFFLILGALSVWKPDSAGQVTAQILGKMGGSADESNKSYHKKEQKIEQTIVNKGTMINVTGSKRTSATVNNKSATKKSRKRPQ